ncbi:MAG: hypothetical protein KBS94_04470 [Prevotella sp.]|nr:hypothetical protein [Candidatus Equicola faecalis]
MTGSRKGHRGHSDRFRDPLELKVDDTVENALAQIDDKGYAIPYEAELQPYKGRDGEGPYEVRSKHLK